MTIYLITITYCEEEDTCVNKPKSQCTSENGCRWSKIKDASCVNQCSNLETKDCNSPCKTESSYYCDINPLAALTDCSSLTTNCESEDNKILCELNQSNGNCQSIDCNTKEQGSAMVFVHG